jgi:hypothetical protein
VQVQVRHLTFSTAPNGRVGQSVRFSTPMLQTLLFNNGVRLVVGSVLGEIAGFCEKVKTLDAKYGPFGFVICAGDFFSDEEDQSNAEELLNGKIQGEHSVQSETTGLH